MLFITTFLCCVILSFVLRDLILKYAPVFYAISIVVIVAYSLHSFGLITIPHTLWRVMFELIQECTLPLALFAVVMFVGALPHDTALCKTLRSIRGPLSIVAWMLSLGHMATYIASYAPRIADGATLSSNVGISFVVAFILFILLMVLGITSFQMVKKHMSTSRWKFIQRFAYLFFGLAYVHVIIMLIPSALRGGIAAQQSIAAYTLVFALYLVARLYRWQKDKQASAVQKLSE